MRFRPSLLIGLASALLAPLAAAHEATLPAACQVGDTPGITIVSSFSFTPEALQAYKNAHKPAPDTTSGRVICVDKDCGIVDDWYWANRMAGEHCNGGLQRSALPALLAHVGTPSYFYDRNDVYDGPAPGANGIQDHHDRYRFSDGLRGVCVACPTTGGTSVQSTELKLSR